jgi:hypothetical protein
MDTPRAQCAGRGRAELGAPDARCLQQQTRARTHARPDLLVPTLDCSASKRRRVSLPLGLTAATKREV